MLAVVSAIRLKECPEPRALTRSLLATRSCSFSTESGRWTSREEKTTLPAQFAVTMERTYSTPRWLTQLRCHL